MADTRDKELMQKETALTGRDRTLVAVAALHISLVERAGLMVREALAASLEQPPTLGKKILHAAQDMGTALAMRMMRAAGK